MKIKNIIISIICALALPMAVFAISDPVVSAVPSQVDANTYTLTINVDTGSKVTVLGGPSAIAPVTDGEGIDALDGVVKVTVGLAQEKKNVFSVSAEKDGAFSNSVSVTINETSAASSGQQKGDTTPPDAPILDPITNPVKAYEYTITGSTEANANIYVKNPDGSKAGSTQANANGLFSVTVDLVPGKTNRFNVSAEDAAYNVGPATQAVIQAVQPDYAKPESGLTEGSGTSASATGHPFTDITGHWAENYISQLYKDGVVSGKTATTFDPNANITRAELTKIALKAFSYNIDTAEPDESPFPDVSADAWYTSYITEAKNAGIVEGYSDGFHPNQAITRAAALKILIEASGLDYSIGSSDFSDVEVGSWYEDYVGFAQSNEVIGGYSDGTFRPAVNITRAQVAKIVIKLVDLAE